MVITPTLLSSKDWQLGPDWPGQRCGARGKRTGLPCRNPAMPNGRCRLHGGLSPGAPKGRANGNYRTGEYTQETIANRRKDMKRIRELELMARRAGHL
jgi:hypothetical protein